MWALAQVLPDGTDLGPTLRGLLIAGVVAASIIAILSLVRLLWRYMAPMWQRIVTVHRLIEGELKPNKGGSVKDTVNRIERKLDARSGEHEELRGRIEELEGRDRE